MVSLYCAAEERSYPNLGSPSSASAPSLSPPSAVFSTGSFVSLSGASALSAAVATDSSPVASDDVHLSAVSALFSDSSAALASANALA